MINNYFTTKLFAINLFLQQNDCRYITTLILGLCIGSFLNVVIYRLPIMLNTKWLEHNQSNNSSSKISLFWPSSFCPRCQNKLKWWMNLPLLSFIILKGRCFFCKKKISLLYPSLELTTALFFTAIAYNYHDLFHLLSYSVFFSVLLVLSIIDWQTMLLPGEITLPLLWLGLLLNLYGYLSGSLLSAVTGAIFGYSFLAIIYWLFKLFAHKEGLGFGDFKLLAAIGAWLGQKYIIPIALLSSLFAIFYALLMFLIAKKSLKVAIPFGPFLALAAICCILFVNYIEPISL